MKALLIVDVQNDLIDRVPNSRSIIPVLNRYITEFEHLGCPIFYTRDWHPVDHVSFADGAWPVHCVQGTSGAEFHRDLLIRGTVVHKGMNKSYDDSSAMKVLLPYFLGCGIDKVYIGGITTEDGVNAHALDILAWNKYNEVHPARDPMETWILADAVAHADAEKGHETMLKLQDLGVRFNVISQRMEVK